MERSLLQKIDLFLKESAMPPTVLGRRAVSDPRLVGDLRRGREPGGRIICRVEQFMNIWRRDYLAGRVGTHGDARTKASRVAEQR